MFKRFLFVLLFVMLTGFAFGQGAGFKRDTAWEAMIIQNPEVVNDLSVGWKDRLILHVLTPEQAKDYSQGADPETLTLADGTTLADYMAARLSPPGNVFVPLPTTCTVFGPTDTDGMEALLPGERLSLRIRGDDLSFQGGSSDGCAIPAEAVAVVMQFHVQGLQGFIPLLKTWAADAPEPPGFLVEHRTGPAERYETMAMVPLCVGESCGEGAFQILSSESAEVRGEAIGYFRPLQAVDQPGGIGGISFYTEGLDDNYFGNFAGLNATGTRNSYFGGHAGRGATTGVDNSGDQNSYFGYGAGYYNTTGNDNAFSGSHAGLKNTSGDYNSFFGSQVGYENTTGGYNSFFGFEAGYSNTVEDSNTFIGANSDFDPGPEPGTLPVTNATAIGTQAYVSQSNSLVLGSIAGQNGASADVNVGIGATAPDTPLHVKRTDGTAQILVEDTGTEPTLTTLHMKNNGRVQAVYENTDTGDTWQLSQHLTGFIVSLVGTGGAEFRVLNDGGVLMGPGAATTFDLDAAGNLIIAGTLTELSDRDEKENIVPVNSKEVLEQVAQLPIAQWTRKGDDEGVRHVGPMAQDFHQAFALGVDERHLATVDTSGIALAAIQGLNEKLQAEISERDAEIENLKAELAEIKAMLAER